MEEVLFTGLLFYFTGGILFSGYLLLKGLSKFDPAAKNTGIGFKIIILPGLITLWPFLLKKLLAQSKEKGL